MLFALVLCLVQADAARTPIDQAISPSSMDVDYVRVYPRKQEP